MHRLRHPKTSVSSVPYLRVLRATSPYKFAKMSKRQGKARRLTSLVPRQKNVFCRDLNEFEQQLRQTGQETFRRQNMLFIEENSRARLNQGEQVSLLLQSGHYETNSAA
jgi:hypothetical protein